MLATNGLCTADISAHVAELQEQLLHAIAERRWPAPNCSIPLTGSRTRVSRLRSTKAMRWYESLLARNCITDVRGDVLRSGLASITPKRTSTRSLSCWRNT